jgi:hypothetical protein
VDFDKDKCEALPAMEIDFFFFSFKEGKDCPYHLHYSF